MANNSFYWALSCLMDTNQQNTEAMMKIRVTSRFNTKSFQYKFICTWTVHTFKSLAWRTKNNHQKCFSCSCWQTTLEVNEISVQFHSLGLCQKNLCWKDFVSKRPVSKISLPTSYENLKHDLCSRMSCLHV